MRLAGGKSNETSLTPCLLIPTQMPCSPCYYFQGEQISVPHHCLCKAVSLTLCPCILGWGDVMCPKQSRSKLQENNLYLVPAIRCWSKIKVFAHLWATYSFCEFSSKIMLVAKYLMSGNKYRGFLIASSFAFCFFLKKKNDFCVYELITEYTWNGLIWSQILGLSHSVLFSGSSSRERSFPIPTILDP